MSRRSGFARALAALDLGWVRVAMRLKIADISRMDEAAKKAVLRLFPYGLYAVTVKHGGEEHGMTANWVTQASFDPPMVVVAVENTSKTIGMIRDAHHFAVNVRSEEHTSELQSRLHLVCRLLLEKKKKKTRRWSLYRSDCAVTHNLPR